MRYFPEIIRILDRFREPRIETIDTGFRKRREDKSFQLYEGIKTGNFKNDAVAAAALYDGEEADTRYSSLKNRLKGRMLNSLFHLNLRRAGYSEHAQAVYTCRKKSYYAHILIALGARNAGVRMAHRTLVLAERYQFVDISLEMALLLRTNASISDKTALYNEYDTLLKSALRQFEAECTSWELFDRAQSVLSRKSGERGKNANLLKTYTQQLRSLLSDDSSFTFRLNYYRLRAMSLGTSGEHLRLVATCEEALSYFRSVPHLAQKPRLGEFYLLKLQSYTAAKDYSMAKETALEIPTLFGYGSNNWFSFAQDYFILLMNTLDFAQANDLYAEASLHPRFALQDETAKERWMIYELYLHYALRRTPSYENAELRTKFDLSRFLTTVPTAAKDKHGLNVAMLIGHVLYMIDGGDFSGINNRIEALTTYRVRYLRVTDNPQSNLFFKLLRVMENTSFRYERALEAGDRYYQELRTIRPAIVHLEEELQIIPYAWLWEQILLKLREFKIEGKLLLGE